MITKENLILDRYCLNLDPLRIDEGTVLKNRGVVAADIVCRQRLWIRTSADGIQFVHWNFHRSGDHRLFWFDDF